MERPRVISSRIHAEIERSPIRLPAAAMTLAREIIEALRSYGGFIPPKQVALVLLRTLRERGPSEGMIRAYNVALKAYVESVPAAERKWKRRKTSGGVWSGYKISPKEKAVCRTRAMLAELIREIEEEIGES